MLFHVCTSAFHGGKTVYSDAGNWNNWFTCIEFEFYPTQSGWKQKHDALIDPSLNEWRRSWRVLARSFPWLWSLKVYRQNKKFHLFFLCSKIDRTRWTQVACTVTRRWSRDVRLCGVLEVYQRHVFWCFFVSWAPAGEDGSQVNCKLCRSQFADEMPVNGSVVLFCTFAAALTQSVVVNDRIILLNKRVVKAASQNDSCGAEVTLMNLQWQLHSGGYWLKK